MRINGKTYHSYEFVNQKPMDIIRHFQLNPESLAVELNGEILPREKWDSVLLKEEDTIELVRFIGGG